MDGFLNMSWKKKIEKIILDEKFRLLCYSFAILIIEMIVAIFFLDISFMTNDDSGLQAALNGTYTGSPYPYHQFINVFLGLFLCELYNIIPCTQWWYIWSMFCMLSGLFMLHYTVLKISPNKRCSFIIISIFIGIFELYCLSNVSFTLVPMIFSLGGISLFFGEKKEYQWSWRRIGFISGILLIASLHRYLSALVMFCFYALGLLYYTVNSSDSSKLKKVIRYIGTILVVAILLVGTAKISSNIQENLNGQYFTELNEYRGIFMDFPHPSYEEKPEVYEKYGWDETTYTLICAWCFMPDEYNLEALRGIVSELELDGLATNYGNNVIEGLKKQIIDGFHNIRNFVRISRSLDYDNIMKIVIAFFLGVSSIYLITRRKKINPINLVFALFCIGGGLLILLYFILVGRSIIRATLCTIIPMIVIALLLYIKQLALENDFVECTARKKAFLSNGIIFAGILLTILSLISVVKIEKNNNDIAQSYMEYGTSHPENIYIYTNASVSSTDIKMFLPRNMVFWGGSAVYSHFYFEQMHALGLEKLTIETLNDDNVYLISEVYDGKTYTVDLIEEKIAQNAEQVEIELIDMINENTGVFKFTW